MSSNRTKFVAKSVAFHTDETPAKIGDVISLYSGHGRGDSTDPVRVIAVQVNTALDHEGRPVGGVYYAARPNTSYRDEASTSRVYLASIGTLVTTYEKFDEPEIPASLVTVNTTSWDEGWDDDDSEDDGDDF